MAVNPKNIINLVGTTLVILSMDSIVSENRLANKIRKKNQETLNTKGHKTFIIQKFKVGLLVNHKWKSTKMKIKKIIIGTKIIVINTIKRLNTIPFISFDMISIISLYF